MDHVNIITSFIAGVVMFLAPCTLPLIPGFISYISRGEKKEVSKSAAFFCLGFLIVFLIFGLFAGLLGAALAPYKFILQKIGAIIVIIFGLHLLHVFNLPLFRGSKISERLKLLYKGRFGAFFFGVSFALGWSPCVGPVLAGIFFYAAFSWSVLQSLWLFLFFSLGFIIPFMIVALLVRSGKTTKLASSKWFDVLAGLILIFVGILLFTDDFGSIAGFFYRALDFINYENIEKAL